MDTRGRNLNLERYAELIRVYIQKSKLYQVIHKDWILLFKNAVRNGKAKTEAKFACSILWD